MERICVCVCGGGGVYVTLHCHPQNDSFIQIGSDESHFNVFIKREEQRVTRRCPQTTIFEEKGEPMRGIELTSLSSYNALPLGQTGSQFAGESAIGKIAT